jgi:hypothetical protein
VSLRFSRKLSVWVVSFVFIPGFVELAGCGGSSTPGGTAPGGPRLDIKAIMSDTSGKNKKSKYLKKVGRVNVLDLREAERDRAGTND